MTKAQIMKRAHEIAKTLECDYMARMSMALRQAWAEAKAPDKQQFTGYAKMVQPSRANNDDECCYLYFKGWQRHGKSRVYINDYKNRTLGFIENGKAIVNNKQGLDTADINACISTFMSATTFKEEHTMKKTYTIAWNSYIEGAGYGSFEETVESRTEAIKRIKAHLYYSWDKVDVTVRENGEIVQTLSYTGKQIGR